MPISEIALNLHSHRHIQMHNEQKVAQMAAYLIRKDGERMAHLKLMKLLYLSDREAMSRYGFPMSGDSVVAMPHGPVLSQTLNLMDGDVESQPGGWEAWISDKENHEVSLRNSAFAFEELDQLSRADIEVLDAIWQQFGHMGKYEIRDYTHNHCSEWHDPKGSSHPIPLHNIFTALGRSHEEAITLAENIEAERSVDRLFASL